MKILNARQNINSNVLESVQKMQGRCKICSCSETMRWRVKQKADGFHLLETTSKKGGSVGIRTSVSGWFSSVLTSTTDTTEPHVKCSHLTMKVSS